MIERRNRSDRRPAVLSPRAGGALVGHRQPLEVAVVERDVVGLDHVVEGLGHEIEDIEVLAGRQAAVLDDPAENLELGRQVLDPQPGDLEPLEHLVQDPVGLGDGLAGHVAVVEIRDAGLELRLEEVHHPQQQPHGVELGLAVGAVHGRDPGRDVALVVDVLEGLGDLGRGDLRPELLENPVAGRHHREGIRSFERLGETP